MNARNLSWTAVAVAFVFVSFQSRLDAQQVTVTTPLIGVNDSFYEHINLGWGMHRNWPGGSWFMNFGGPMSALPPFGGYNPAADFRFGLGSSSPSRGFHFNFAASQGSNRSMTMVAPSMTMMNGARGHLFSGSLRPFVTGLIPVVGDYPVMVPYVEYPYYSMAPPMAPTFVSPLAEKVERLKREAMVPPTPLGADETDALVLAETDEPVEAISSAPSSAASTAVRGDISLAEIRRMQAAEDEAKRKEIAELVRQAKEAEVAKQFGVARVFYKRAAQRTDGQQREELLSAAARLPLRATTGER